MAFKIVWSEIASEDLREIVRYVALDNPDAAADLADRIIGRIERASELPLSNRAVPEKGDRSVREAILRPYRIIYQVDRERSAVQVLRIWHASRGVPELE